MLHVDIPTHAQMDQLVRARRQGSVSIYVPTTPVTPDAGASRIDFRNAVDEALSQLRDDGFDKRELADLEAHLRDLVDDDEFWRLQAHSLAVFATPEHIATFRLANRLSRAVEVSDRFHTKGLFRAITFPQSALVLALAIGSVRLVEITPDLPAETLRVPDLPRDAASAVGKASITDRTASGRIQGSEGQKVLMTQYARAVSRAIAPFVLATEIPLILAAAEPIATIFRGVDASATLAPRGIEGSPEGMSDPQLAAASRSVLDELYASQLAEVRDLYGARNSAGRASSDVAQVARAATVGAVDTLLVDMDATVPGFVDEASGAIELRAAGDARDYGVVDEIARRTFIAGGRVLAVRRDDIPGAAPLAAILRYPV
jgi:release factor family 11